MSMDSTEVASVALMVGTASGVFAGFCPSWFTVASPFFHAQGSREGNIKRIRWGEIAATIIVMGMGASLAHLSGNTAVFWASAGICLIFVAGYEYMIAHPASEDGAAA